MISTLKSELKDIISTHPELSDERKTRTINHLDEFFKMISDMSLENQTIAAIYNAICHLHSITSDYMLIKNQRDDERHKNMQLVKVIDELNTALQSYEKH